jgi:hypothetical protein
MISFDGYNNYVKATAQVKEEQNIKFVEDQLALLNSYIDNLKDSLRRSVSTKLASDVINQLKKAEIIIENPSSIQQLTETNAKLEKLLNGIKKYEMLIENANTAQLRLRDFLKINIDSDRVPEAMTLIKDIDLALASEDMISIESILEDIDNFFEDKNILSSDREDLNIIGSDKEVVDYFKSIDNVILLFEKPVKQGYICNSEKNNLVIELMPSLVEIDDKASEIEEKLSEIDQNKMRKLFIRMQNASEGFQNLMATNSIDYSC